MAEEGGGGTAAAWLSWAICDVFVLWNDTDFCAAVDPDLVVPGLMAICCATHTSLIDAVAVFAPVDPLSDCVKYAIIFEVSPFWLFGASYTSVVPVGGVHVEFLLLV